MRQSSGTGLVDARNSAYRVLSDHTNTGTSRDAFAAYFREMERFGVPSDELESSRLLFAQGKDRESLAVADQALLTHEIKQAELTSDRDIATQILATSFVALGNKSMREIVTDETQRQNVHAAIDGIISPNKKGAKAVARSVVNVFARKLAAALLRAARTVHAVSGISRALRGAKIAKAAARLGETLQGVGVRLADRSMSTTGRVAQHMLGENRRPQQTR